MNRNDIENSLVLIGPTSIGKSLVSSALAEKTKTRVVHFDDLYDYVYSAYTQDDYSTGPITTALRYCYLVRCSKEINKGTRLTKTQKQLRKAQILGILRQHREYKELVSDFRDFAPAFDEYGKMMHSRKTDNRFAQLFYENILEANILLRAMQKINEPIILDTCGITWLDFEKYRDEILGPSPTREAAEEFDQYNNFLKKLMTTFPVRVYLKPDEDYLKNANPKIHGEQNQFILAHQDAFESLSTLSVAPGKLFNNPESEAFKTRDPLDIISLEKRQGELNKARLNEICEEIIGHQSREREK